MDTHLLPLARTDETLVLEMGDETVVYDLARHRAHCLNVVARLVWRMCDGRTTVDQMTAAVAEAMGSPPDPDIVWYALRRLNGARLLSGPLRREASARTVSRRDLLRRATAAGLGVMLLPAVATIVAPSTLQAQASCLPSGSPCSRTVGSPCCTGRCTGSPPGSDVGTCS